ncbi:MAG: hypothetical protein IT385_00530 [Deltaproteobacteria bacterium]|nr:hypothetical protein [Deltaproteobacteria bacterium]
MTTSRLCRLRHATLHPGATLWTPGVGGGNLGGGAASALDDAGVGGLVVVGFQASAREPVHRGGVLAEVQERVPFPESWNPEGLGATHRYRLLGVSRVEIDPATCTNKRVPTVIATAGGVRPEDALPPPPELVQLLQALARLDNPWPEHWLEAFRILPTAPLGQWATTLGWRLSREERLQLFDQPGRIPEVLLSTLDGLHLGLAPERRREAVRVQTLTRRTTAMPERVVPVVVDEDGWALFHPADVASVGSSGTTTGPVSVGVAGHLAAGNAVVVKAAPGRRCLVRFTVAPLSPTEEAARQGESTFRLLVRHGRLFLGGASLLRAGYQDRLEFADAQQWIDVPNGLYRAVVTSQGAGDEGADDHVDYVVRLVPEASLEAIVAPASPPTL